MSDTPRTAECLSLDDGGNGNLVIYRLAGLVEQLERDIAAAKAENERLRELARLIAAASDYNPGESDLDDEQPVTCYITLGDVRRARSALAGKGEK
jgi:hypothetical protein